MIVHMTRRDLAKLAASGAALLGRRPMQADDTGKYTGALDGFEGKVNLAGFDPVAYTKKLHDAAPLRMTFTAQTRSEAERWQKDLRAKVTELVADFLRQVCRSMRRRSKCASFRGIGARNL